MKGYKAFEKGMICRGKQYAENTVFEEESDKICESGMHFCKNPLDVLDYYPLVDENGNMSEFAEVKALDGAKTDDGKNYCTKKLKISAKISFPALVQASLDCELEKTTQSKTKNHDEDNEKISSRGYSARIGSSGAWARIGSSGDWAQIGSSGDWARIGSSGDSAQIGSSGDWAQIGSSGYKARIGSSGYKAQIGSSGAWAQIGSSGDSARIKSTGKNSVICCAGYGCCASAKIGSWITLAEWGKDASGEYKPLCVKTEYVDGERIKENTLYKLENGEFVEVKE
nr:MAG TPA: hypothetical protein [Caudoviricetes sp.]